MFNHREIKMETPGTPEEDYSALIETTNSKTRTNPQTLNETNPKDLLLSSSPKTRPPETKETLDRLKDRESTIIEGTITEEAKMTSREAGMVETGEEEDPKTSGSSSETDLGSMDRETQEGIIGTSG